VLVLVFCLCPSSVSVVATFSGTVLFPKYITEVKGEIKDNKEN
jgi:hypothetical protein